MNDPSGINTSIDLAQEADFVLGGLRISPSACRVANGGDEERIEPRVMEVLIVLARSTGRTITREQLIEACWDGRAVSDDAVTRVIAKLRALGRADPPHFTLETIPKVGFRLIARPVETEASEPGTLPDLAQANGPANPQPADRVGHNAGLRRVWGAVAIALAVAVLAIATAWGLAQPPARRVAETPHVVVSPINVLQTRTELHRLAGATTTALLSSLTGTGVQTSMSTSASLPGQAAAQPGTVMLAGSADFDGVVYRVNVTATDHASARVLWSGSFERPAVSVRGLEQEVALDVATILQCAFKARQARAADMELGVFSQFLNACESMIGWRSGSDLKATQSLVAVAPEYADAHAFRAIALNRRADTLDHLNSETQELRREAQAETQKALDIDPGAVNAHVVFGRILAAQSNFAKSEQYLRRALALDPENTRALDGYGMLLRRVGRVGAAREVFERIPQGPNLLIQSAFLQAMNGDTVAAERLLEQLAVMRPSWASSARFMVTVFWTEPRAALTKLPAFQEGEGRRDVSCFETHLKALTGPPSQARRGLPKICEKVAADWKVRMLARQGDIDGAYTLMHDLPNSRSFLAFLFYPEMKAFRHDKRFMPLADRLGLLRYWRETNQWPDFCAEPDLPYDCRAWRRSN